MKILENEMYQGDIRRVSGMDIPWGKLDKDRKSVV